MTLTTLSVWTLLAVTDISKLLILAAMLKLHHDMRPTLTVLGRSGLLLIAFAALASLVETLSLDYAAHPATALLFAALAVLSIVRAFFPAAFTRGSGLVNAMGSRTGIHLAGIGRRT